MLYPTYGYGRRDPFSLMQNMMRDFDPSLGPSARRPVFPAVNVWRGTDAVAVTAELPGVEPGDIEISVQENVLKLTGERKAPDIPEAATWHRRERGFGKFSRAVQLPFAARDSEIEARVENGVLRVIVGRPEEDKPRRIKVKAG